VISFILFAGAFLALALALFVRLREAPSIARTSFAVVMIILALESFCDAFAVAELDAKRLFRIEELRFFISSLTPGFWLLFTLSYSRGNAREFLIRNRPLIICFFLAPPLILLLFRTATIVEIGRIVPDQTWFVRLGWAGSIFQVLFLSAAALSLINLERTFRSATGTMRWRIKYMVLGCAVLLGARIYTSSQAILFHGIDLNAVEIQSIARLVGYLVLAFALVRSRLAEVDLYPSHEFLYQSLTAILAGAYLLLVGVIGKFALYFKNGENIPLKSLIILVGLLGLAVLLMSDRVRQATQLAVSRHLRRPIHDYRKVWTLFTERTAALVTHEEYCRAVTCLISETFSVLSVTLFLVDDQKHQLLFGASTSLNEAQANEILRGAPDVAALADWRGNADPVDMDNSAEPWLLELRKLGPGFFQQGGGRVCVPLVASGRFLGLITLTDRVSGVPFSPEDFELLKCLGGQVAAGLLNISLSSSLLRAKELEAFQTMSTFFVHDLKNTALMLSLMLKNLPVHFANPDFREDSLRAIGKSVERINDLISRLSLLRKGLEINPVETDLNALVSSCLGTIPRNGVDLDENLQPVPKIMIDPEQMQKVFINLVLNARDAVEEGGEIEVTTGQTNGWAVLQVSDNGCGISPEFMQRSLFRPFQSTKKKGIGIGMYQSKMIVEAHSGRIEVKSDLGKGTTFRVLLPIRA
jgi:putative PEP-CTERM system histidine kinase